MGHDKLKLTVPASCQQIDTRIMMKKKSKGAKRTTEERKSSLIQQMHDAV